MGRFVTANEVKSVTAHEVINNTGMRSRLQEYLFVIETVILADEKYSDGEYESAQDYFLNAMDRARYADQIGTGYMERKLDKLAEYLSVTDYIILGDSLLEKEEYAKAEEKYLMAKQIATNSHYTEGKDTAMAALEKLYDKWAAAEEQKEQEANRQAEKETSAAALVASGDKACMEQDFTGAKVYYTMALAKYQELADAVNEQYAQSKLDSVEEKLAEQEAKRQRAEALEQQGIRQQAAGDFWGAKSSYLQAKGFYLELGSGADVERVSNMAAQLDALIEQGETD